MCFCKYRDLLALATKARILCSDSLSSATSVWYCGKKISRKKIIPRDLSANFKHLLEEIITLLLLLMFLLDTLVNGKFGSLKEEEKK